MDWKLSAAGLEAGGRYENIAAARSGSGALNQSQKSDQPSSMEDLEDSLAFDQFLHTAAKRLKGRTGDLPLQVLRSQCLGASIEEIAATYGVTRSRAMSLIKTARTSLQRQVKAGHLDPRDLVAS